MNELTSTAKKIMEVFRYFRIKKDDFLSVKLMLSRRHLWGDIDEETFDRAMSELTEMRYIEKMGNPAGWKLLAAGEEYLKQHPG